MRQRVIIFASFGVAQRKRRFTFIFSNREPGDMAESDAFFELVYSYQIPFICLSSYRFKESYGEGWRKDGQPIEGYNPSCEVDQRVKGILAK